MSKVAAPATRKRRADAERNIDAILDAAVELLGDRPDASMGDVAAAAGLSRQTVYAHYSSREELLGAVARRALDRTLAAIDEAEPEKGSPVAALARLIDAWWGNVARHARVLGALGQAAGRDADLHAFHEPVLDRLVKLIRRGRRSGAFDRTQSDAWLATAFLGLMHTAADEVAAGRMTAEAAGRELARTIPRVFGAEPA
jgi:AcrR family transcriptional regulator